MIHFVWAPGTWEVDALVHENPSVKNFVGLGRWLTDRIPLDIYDCHMMCPPGYEASFGPIPSRPDGIFESWDAPSYKESVSAAIDFGVELILNLSGSQIVLGGYSQGAEVAERLKAEFLPGGRLQDRKLLAHYTFGNPGRPAGVTFPNGNVLPWPGIAQLNIPNPQGCLYRSYNFFDDMYGNANPQSYVFDFYNSLTEIQMHDPVAMARNIIQNLTKTDLMVLVGAQPNNPIWILSNLPKFIDISRKAANTIDAAARMVRGSHGAYASWEIIPGFTPINHCVRSMKYLAKGLGYHVLGI